MKYSCVDGVDNCLYNGGNHLHLATVTSHSFEELGDQRDFLDLTHLEIINLMAIQHQLHHRGLYFGREILTKFNDP
jgi:hypothetical protein